MAPIAFRRRTIRGEKTVGEVLQSTRERLKICVAEAERATHVRSKYLMALESGDFDALPEEVYTLGFLNRYAQFLNLDTNALISQYQGELLASLKLSPAKPKSRLLTLPTRKNNFGDSMVILGPRFIWAAASLVIFVGIASYLWYQVRGFVDAPDLQIASPTSETVVATPSVSIVGRTEEHALVTINAEPVAIDPEGNFTQEVKLENGVNTIEVTAVNRLNKETKKQLKILATF